MEVTKHYQCYGTCSKMITVTIEENKIKHVQFYGGCHGNTQGVAALVKGMTAQEAIDRLSGIQCGFRSTSCPDQLSKALSEALASIS